MTKIELWAPKTANNNNVSSRISSNNLRLLGIRLFEEVLHHALLVGDQNSCLLRVFLLQ
jgi:hypothetical protein